MRKYLIPILFVIIQVSAFAQTPPTLYEKIDKNKMNQWVNSIFNELTDDEKIGQLFMIVADPRTTDANTQKILKNISDQKIGGILFSKGELIDQAESTNKYQKVSKIPLLISLDGEWGLSMRLTNTTQFPRNMALGAIADDQLLIEYGKEVGRQCKEMGIHINFAPVLDVNSNPNNPVIGNRSFGENPEAVSSKGIAYAKGLESMGIIAVAKHFPGHGDTSEDSHKTTPVVTNKLSHLKEVELYPFKKYIEAGFSGVMTGHLSVPALDNKTGNPTSLSPIIVTNLLKNNMGFSGLTFTDALVMKGATSDRNVCVDALLAGNDILLSSGAPVTDFKAVKKAVADGIIKRELIEEKCRKILEYKYIVGLNNYKPIVIKGLEDRLNTIDAEYICRKLNENSITLLKNDSDILPVKKLGTTTIAVLSIGDTQKTEFQRMLENYCETDNYFITSNTTEKTATNIFRKLASYDLIICGVHRAKSSDMKSLQQLADKNNVVLAYFATPYNLDNFSKTSANAKAVIMAYENTPFAQEYAAQIIMGGIPSKGKLPVTLPDFPYGTGFETCKIRLSYELPVKVGMSMSKLSNIDKIVAEGIDEKAFPGCEVLVAKDGVVVYNKAFGYFDYANTHPVEVTDLYDLASVTKATATVPAIMELYDEKKIGLNDKISKYVPILKNTDKEDITIKEALFHESGLTSFIPFYQLAVDKDSYSGSMFSSRKDQTYRILYDDNTYGRTDFSFRSELVSDTLKKGFTSQVAQGFYVSDNFKNLILREIADSKLKKKRQYLYSDLNFMLLKEVVENVSKLPFDEFLQKRFYNNLGANYTMFHPLGKTDMAFIAPTENDQMIRRQILIGYPHDEAAAFMGGVSGNAGLFSNANDLAKLLQMFLYQGQYGGEKYLSAETCRLFTKTKSSNSRRGLGFDKPDPKDTSSGSSGRLVPASVYGHTGFTGTCFWVDPDNNLIYIFLSNRVYPSRTYKKLMTLNIRTRIQDVIYESMDNVK